MLVIRSLHVRLRSVKRMSNFTVITDDDATELRKLRDFYKEVAHLTINHDVLYPSSEGPVDDGAAVVFPSKLGTALSKVNPHWFAND